VSRKIAITLPDGVAKRTMVAGVDAGMKWGNGLYLEIFITGLGVLEAEIKQKKTEAPAPAKQTKKER